MTSVEYVTLIKQLIIIAEVQLGQQIYIMFKKSDFKKIEVLGAGKKNTKIYQALHIPTGKFYALKEIQGKTLEKLNEFKEQAEQLRKVQNHPNVIKYYAYFLSQTRYNTFKIGIVTELMDKSTNLQLLYRKRKKANMFWSQAELVSMYCSLVSTCSFLQSKGICHRDIKPANLFLLQNNEMKVIDFGESKDYFYDPNDEDRETFTMATIRGTPQYLSPILWKAHVIDGNSRFAEHNIYKSDVFSTGLVLIQFALMKEVTGFNSKTLQVNGQKLIKEHLKILQKMYSTNFAQLMGLLLRFQESDRPSFCQIQALFYQKQQSCKQKGKTLNELIKYYNDNYNNITKNAQQFIGATASLKSTFPLQQAPTSEEQQTKKQLIQEQLQTRPPKNNYYKDSTLMLHESCYWFQFGGSSIGRFSISRQKWKIDPGNQSKKFPLHFSVIFIPTTNEYYLLGGPMNDNFRVFHNKKLMSNKVQMPTFRNFFAPVYHSQKVYVFGGYDGQTKTQIKSGEYYDIVSSKWYPIADLKISRSQSGGCRINDDEILICGGYNKQLGTLDSIERYIISKDKIQMLKLKLPIPLRRFMIVRVAKNKALVLGGLTVNSKQSQRVFKLDYQDMHFQELQNLQKGGVIENEILVDGQNNLHIFIQHSNGTSTHSHIKYPYDPTKQACYETQQI